MRAAWPGSTGSLARAPRGQPRSSVDARSFMSYARLSIEIIWGRLFLAHEQETCKEAELPTQILLITTGNPSRLTGGYLYNRRMLGALQARGIDVAQCAVRLCPPLLQPLFSPQVLVAIHRWRPQAVVVDSIALGYVAPILGLVRGPAVVALMHQWPSAAREEEARWRRIEGSRSESMKRGRLLAGTSAPCPRRTRRSARTTAEVCLHRHGCLWACARLDGWSGLC